MCILLLMNIYITSDNQVRLRREKSMSGLVNQLLDTHYERDAKQDLTKSKGTKSTAKELDHNICYHNRRDKCETCGFAPFDDAHTKQWK
jgi:hypothetical protein